jgi:hypothetical protein
MPIPRRPPPAAVSSILSAGEIHMSNAFRVLLDSGAIYLALGAVICMMLGAGAVKRLFQGANKIKTPERGPPQLIGINPNRGERT